MFEPTDANSFLFQNRTLGPLYGYWFYNLCKKIICAKDSKQERQYFYITVITKCIVLGQSLKTLSLGLVEIWLLQSEVLDTDMNTVSTMWFTIGKKATYALP